MSHAPVLQACHTCALGIAWITCTQDCTRAVAGFEHEQCACCQTPLPLRLDAGAVVHAIRPYHAHPYHAHGPFHCICCYVEGTA